MSAPVELTEAALAELEAKASAAKERACAATPGPWEITCHRVVQTVHPVGEDSDDGDRADVCEVLHYGALGGHGFFNDGTARFIAAARADVPELADATRALVDEVHRLREENERIRFFSQEVERAFNPTNCVDVGLLIEQLKRERDEARANAAAVHAALDGAGIPRTGNDAEGAATLGLLERIEMLVDAHARAVELASVLQAIPAPATAHHERVPDEKLCGWHARFHDFLRPEVPLDALREIFAVLPALLQELLRKRASEFAAREPTPLREQLGKVAFETWTAAREDLADIATAWEDRPDSLREAVFAEAERRIGESLQRAGAELVKSGDPDDQARGAAHLTAGRDVLVGKHRGPKEQG